VVLLPHPRQLQGPPLRTTTAATLCSQQQIVNFLHLRTSQL
jgi:hypothetical protein